MSSDMIPPNDHWDELVPEVPQPESAPPSPGTTQMLDQPPTAASPGVHKPKAWNFNPRLLVLPVFGLIALFGWISNRGTTVADDLQPGDCFIMPVDEGEFDRLDTEECTAAHDAQIVRVATVAQTGSLPEFADPYWDLVFERCLESGASVRVDDLPADYELGYFSPTESSWDAGDRTSLCYIYAPSGLDGSMMLGS